MERFDNVDAGIKQVLDKLDHLSGGSTTDPPKEATKK
jgi:hypothetical protein